MLVTKSDKKQNDDDHDEGRRKSFPSLPSPQDFTLAFSSGDTNHAMFIEPLTALSAAHQNSAAA